MKKNIESLFPLLLMFFIVKVGLADSPKGEVINPADPKLYITSTKKVPGYMEITYEITMAGFVELHLFDPTGEKVWIKGRVTDRTGYDKIRIPAKGLKKKGERYTFILKYKGKDISGSFYAD